MKLHPTPTRRFYLVPVLWGGSIRSAVERSAILAWLVAALFPFLPLTAQGDDVSFAKIGNGTPIEHQFDDVGVTFLASSLVPGGTMYHLPVSQVIFSKPSLHGPPPAPRTVADASVCAFPVNCEFYQQAAGIRFANAASGVTITVGLTGDAPGGAQINLRALNENHDVVSSASASVTVSSSTTRAIKVVSPKNDIVYAELLGPSNTSGQHMKIESLHVDHPSTAGPDFDLTVEGASEPVVIGTPAVLKIGLHRHNGSKNSVKLFAVCTPESASLIPDPGHSVFSGTPETADLHISFPTTGPPPSPQLAVTVTGSPFELRPKSVGKGMEVVNSGAGPAARSVKFLLPVTQPFRLERAQNQPISLGGFVDQTSAALMLVWSAGTNDWVSFRAKSLPRGLSASFDPPLVSRPANGDLGSPITMKLQAVPGAPGLDSVVVVEAFDSRGISTTLSLPLHVDLVVGGVLHWATGVDRGCGEFSLSPEWVEADGAARPRTVEGMVIESGGSGEDNMAKHTSIDWTFRLDTDPGYGPLLSDANEEHSVPMQTDVDGATLPAHSALTMEVEWETAYLPDPFRPKVGDRAWVSGRWIFDCGHPPYQSEIHPPQAVAFTRAQQSHLFAGDATPRPANLAFIYVYGRGSSLPGIFDYFSIADQHPEEFAIDYVFDIVAPPRPSASATLIAEVSQLFFGGPPPQLNTDNGAGRVHVTYPLKAYLSQDKTRQAGAIVAVAWRDK